jgi:hypothetical protein
MERERESAGCFLILLAPARGALLPSSSLRKRAAYLHYTKPPPRQDAPSPPDLQCTPLPLHDLIRLTLQIPMHFFSSCMQVRTGPFYYLFFRYSEIVESNASKLLILLNFIHTPDVCSFLEICNFKIY